jgi:hypothetical protein
MTPKDASILALIAENPQISPDNVNRLVGLADDQDEVRSVAEVILRPDPNGAAPSGQAQSTAEFFLRWVKENRTQPA